MKVSNNILLEVKSLSSFYEGEHKSFRKTQKKQVLKNISFEIYENEIVGLVGESGCGKSTLAKTVLGLVSDYTGEIKHYSELPQMVFQDPFSSLNPQKSIKWILEEPLRVKRIPKKEREEKALWMLDRIGLGKEYAERLPDELSGGQRQRVAIASAIITNPKFLIADEPVSALDVTVQAQILRLMKELKEEFELSYLFISHDLDVIYQICDRVMVMKNGEIVEIGLTDEIFNDPKHEYTKLLLNG